MKLTLDAWDVGAVAAGAAVLAGLGVWHWPAALVAAGVMYLAVYFLRERNLAAQSPHQRRE